MKKASCHSIVLSGLIIILAVIGAGMGVFWRDEGQKAEFHTLRGETVTIQGHGLYKYETVSIAAQAAAQDAVTLLVGIPLLFVSMLLFKKGNLRGKLLLAGTLAYFLYTYASFAFGAAYNILFLVYVSLFSLSLFAFILTIMEIDISTLPDHFSSGLPRRTISSFLFLVGVFLSLAWLGRIIPALMANKPPLGLESYTTLIIQALDLGVVVPLAFLAGILLWKQNAWGYLLSSIVLIKGITLALAVSAMAVNMIMAGVQVSIGELIMFPTIALVSTGLTAVLLKNVNVSNVSGD
jgi:hypothetical protein